MKRKFILMVSKFFCSIIFLMVIVIPAYGQSMQPNRLSVDLLDNESRQCMRCHDGLGGKTIELRPANAPLEFDRGRWMKTKNHSIGISYSESENKNPREYVSAGSLNPNIKLVEGKMGCLSCHVAKPQLLASLSVETNSVSNECSADIEGTKKAFQGNLCLYCHRK